ncbi:MAG: hypothetical protein V3R56_05870 [Xanthomonadales bacterium]
MSDRGNKQINNGSADETANKPSSSTLSRRRLLGQAGKALYLAPALTVIGLAPKLAGAQNISCAPPPPDSGACPDSAPVANPRTESNQRQNWKQKRRKDKS